LHCRSIELRIQPTLESQRGKSVGFFRLTSIVALRVVGAAGARELGSSLSALHLNLLSFLRKLELSNPSLGLREIDVSFRAESIEERP